MWGQPRSGLRPLYEVGEYLGRPYLAMEFIDGCDLRAMRALLRRPVAFYLGLSAVGMSEYLFGRKVVPGVEPMRLGGLSLRQWFFYYAAYESMLHFYTDGFLWKIRSRAVQRAI